MKKRQSNTGAVFPAVGPRAEKRVSQKRLHTHEKTETKPVFLTRQLTGFAGSSVGGSNSQKPGVHALRGDGPAVGNALLGNRQPGRRRPGPSPPRPRLSSGSRKPEAVRRVRFVPGRTFSWHLWTRSAHEVVRENNDGFSYIKKKKK